MLLRLDALIRKEFIQFLRDRFTMALVVYIFLEIALCAWGLSMDVRNTPLAVVDRDQTPTSRALVGELTSGEAFRLVPLEPEESALSRAIDRGRVQVGVVIPQGFEAAWLARRTTPLQVIVNGTNSAFAAQNSAYVQGILVTFAQQRLERDMTALGLSPSQLPAVTLEVRAGIAPGLNYTHFVMVNMLAIAVTFVGVILASASMIREREEGTLEQLMVSPVRTFEVVAAKLGAMSVFTFFGLLIGLGMSLFGFGVPLRGSLGLFLALSVVMFTSVLGLGALIAAVTRTMQQALLLAFFVLFPVMFLSGTILPIENMPVALQWLSYLSPLRYYTQIALGIFLKGAGLAQLWTPSLALAVFSVAIVSASSWLAPRSIR